VNNRDDNIGAHFQEPVVLPGIEVAGTAVRLIAGHGNRQASDLLGVLDLDIAVPQSQQLLSGNLVLTEDALDDHSLVELPVVIRCAINMVPKIRR
jgi:hypothetical protein